jgi:2-C-methyl-D-erythritol 4-phosphate cytidylyltransferase
MRPAGHFSSAADATLLLIKSLHIQRPRRNLSKAYALVPAAGSGSRLGAALPKQYLEIAGRPLLYHSLLALAQHPRIEQVFVVLAQGDDQFRRHDWRDLGARVEPLYCGGETRAASVFNGLLAARDSIAAADWVLVHDAARPCLGSEELDRLFGELETDDTGGLLAVPVADTLKRGNRDSRVAATEPRDNLWLAQTPQMFRYRLLIEALRAADPAAATDEARAIEGLGLKPRLVLGDTRNIKVTFPEDLLLAELIIRGREGKSTRMRPGSKPGKRTAGNAKKSKIRTRSGR